MIAQLSRQSHEYQQQYLQQTIDTVKPKVVIPIHWDDFWQPLTPKQPLEFLPYIADNTHKSLKILIDHAEKQIFSLFCRHKLSFILLMMHLNQFIQVKIDFTYSYHLSMKTYV